MINTKMTPAMSAGDERVKIKKAMEPFQVHYALQVWATQRSVSAAYLLRKLDANGK